MHAGARKQQDIACKDCLKYKRLVKSKVWIRVIFGVLVLGIGVFFMMNSLVQPRSLQVIKASNFSNWGELGYYSFRQLHPRLPNPGVSAFLFELKDKEKAKSVIRGFLKKSKDAKEFSMVAFAEQAFLQEEDSDFFSIDPETFWQSQYQKPDFNDKSFVFLVHPKQKEKLHEFARKNKLPIRFFLSNQMTVRYEQEKFNLPECKGEVFSMKVLPENYPCFAHRVSQLNDKNKKVDPEKDYAMLEQVSRDHYVYYFSLEPVR